MTLDASRLNPKVTSHAASLSAWHASTTFCCCSGSVIHCLRRSLATAYCNTPSWILIVVRFLASCSRCSPLQTCRSEYSYGLSSWSIWVIVVFTRTSTRFIQPHKIYKSLLYLPCKLLCFLVTFVVQYKLYNLALRLDYYTDKLTG